MSLDSSLRRKGSKGSVVGDDPVNKAKNRKRRNRDCRQAELAGRAHILGMSEAELSYKYERDAAELRAQCDDKKSYRSATPTRAEVLARLNPQN